MWSFFQVLGETIHITSDYPSQEAKVTSVGSKVEALEVENSKLSKDLIATMDEANTAKKKAKVLANNLRAKRQVTLEKDEQLHAANEKVKTIIAKTVEAFQQIGEYNIVLFSWYYKGFKLLRQYLVKHPTSMDLGSLDLEEVDKEMEANEASQSIVVVPKGNAPKPTPAGGDKAAT